jgi:hypothetical protein
MFTSLLVLLVLLKLAAVHASKDNRCCDSIGLPENSLLPICWKTA